MKIDVLTLFPEIFRGPLQISTLKRAQERKIVNIRIFDIRLFTKGKHRLTDDYPYGGGPGMIMKPEPIFEAVGKISGKYNLKLRKKREKNKSSKIILLTPQGEIFSQQKAKILSQKNHLIFVCGRYKGVDERIKDYLIDEEISIGDYVLSGGEVAAWVVIESIVRLIPGAVGSEESVITDSFYETQMLDCPYYTRPYEYLGRKVPKILISGDHQKIQSWKRIKALEKTLSKRPDLFSKANLSRTDRLFLKKIKGENS